MGFLKKGKETEEQFAKLFNNYEKSSKEQDINEHWDLEIKHKIDVKGLKKINRKDNSPNENFHWIEIKNVHGNKGWLYGEADLFAFELNEFWVIVPKEALQERIATKTVKEYYDTPTLNGLYQRRGRNDVITIISSYDLCSICISMVEKK